MLAWSPLSSSSIERRLHLDVLSINGTGSAPVPANAWPDNTTPLKKRLLAEEDANVQHRDLPAPNRAFSLSDDRYDACALILSREPPERATFKSRSRGRSLNQRMPIGDGHLDVLHPTGVWSGSGSS